MEVKWSLLRRNEVGRKLFLLGIGVILIFVVGIIIWQVKQSSIDDRDKVVFRSPQARPIDSSSLMKLPENSSSTICKKITRDQIQDIIREQVQEKTIPFSDAKTKEGTTAGCSYAVAESKTQKLRAVSIMVRTIDDKTVAQKVYAGLTQDKGKSVSGLTGSAYYIEDSNQLQYLKGNAVIAITISKLDPDVEIEVEMLKSVAALL